MKFYLALATALTIGGLVVAQGGATPGVAHVDKAAMDTALAGGLNIVVDDSSEWGLRVLGMRRVKPGSIESHASESTVFYIIDGEADVVMGGAIVNMKETRPGEKTGTDLTGGQTVHLVKGESLVAPAGVPYWFKNVPDHIAYFVVKVANPHRLPLPNATS
jgi:mannose-6-phosphate isomerase-like protein (cupin superfamily)